MVKFQSSKLAMRVRFPLPAPALNSPAGFRESGFRNRNVQIGSQALACFSTAVRSHLSATHSIRADAISGQKFGAHDSIVGYETDGCELEWREGLPFATHKDGTPETFTVLGTCPVRWHPDDCEWYERREKGRIGAACMGIYTRGGTVFTAGTTDWALGLRGGTIRTLLCNAGVLQRVSGTSYPMPNFPHLTRAPIVEALIHFQANAADRWEPEKVRDELQPAWPEHTEVQEMRPVQFEMKLEVGKSPETRVVSPDAEGFLFRSKNQRTVYHARRDGLIVSWLAPYSDWSTFLNAAMVAWDKFQEILAPSELYSVALRYINRLEFPLADFRLSTFFTTPPAKPPTLGDWGFNVFSHQTVFDPPNSPHFVQTNFLRTEAASENVAFILDIQVGQKKGIGMERSTKEMLEEMHVLKNTIFFAMLTDATLERYK